MKSATLILLVGCTVVVGCGGARTEADAEKVVTVTATVAAQPTTTDDEFEDAPDSSDTGETTTAPTSGTAEVTVGESAEDDGVLFKVTRLAEVEELPRSYNSPIRPRKGTDLWAAVIAMKNQGSTGVDPMCGGGSAVLIDTDQRNFEPITDSISIKGNNAGFCGGNIQPGFKATVTLGFYVPKETEIAGIAVWNGDSEDDFFGDTYVVFALA
jgi:hypothetical protein